MPANLTADYLAAEAEYRVARDAAARMAALERMLAVIPKHKGTDHLRGALRKRLGQLKDEARHEKKGGYHVDVSVVPREGAGQVVLLGPPNSGKSALLAALTHAQPDVAPYPFTTTHPLPGMMAFEDVKLQLVDTPPIGQAHFDGWMSSLVRRADAALLVVDPSDPANLDDLAAIRERLANSGIQLVAPAPADGAAGTRAPAGEWADEVLLERLEPSAAALPTLLVATKQDLEPRPADTDALVELGVLPFPVVRVSAPSGRGLDELRRGAWALLDLIRVYTKPPGAEASRSDPDVLPRGATVRDLAGRIHRELAERLSFARIWGAGYRPGQRVAADQPLQDGDTVELHA